MRRPLPRQGQPVEAAPMGLRRQHRGGAVEEAWLGGGVGRRLGPAGAQNIGGLLGSAGAAEGIGQPLVAIQAARRAGGEPQHGQCVVRLKQQGFLDAAAEQRLPWPFRVAESEAGDLRRAGAAAARLQPHPGDHPADRRVRAQCGGLSLRPALGIGEGDRLPAGGTGKRVLGRGGAGQGGRQQGEESRARRRIPGF
ncbi:hypothetical protein ACFQU2_36420 [Siccirubricoccus deserti]